MLNEEVHVDEVYDFAGPFASIALNDRDIVEVGQIGFSEIRKRAVELALV